MLARSVFTTALVSAFTTGFAHAQWTTTNLHPAGAETSQCLDASPGQQVGSITDSFGNTFAGYWTGSAPSWTNLNPAGANFSQANGAGSGMQAGVANFGGAYAAGFWTGSSGTWTDLTPAGFTEGCVATCADANQQGGVVTLLTDQYYDHAALWTSSSASFVDLHPTHVLGAENSLLNGMGDGQQVGWTDFNGHSYTAASLWTGTPTSWVNLNPTNVTIGYCQDASGGHQVGYVLLEVTPGSDLEQHASLWSGTPESWVDLHPAGVLASQAQAIAGAHQAGNIVDANGQNHASYWNNTASSWVDLHTFLPNGYESSYVTGISIDATTIYVAGLAITNGGLGQHAMLWTRPIVVACVADVDDGTGTGTPDGGVTIDDLLYYLAIFEAGSVAADVDDGTGTGTHDGGVTIDDLLYYLFRFESGC